MRIIPVLIALVLAASASTAAAEPPGQGLDRFSVECDGTTYEATHAGGGNSAWIEDQHVIHVSASFPGGSVTWGEKLGLGDSHECHPADGVTVVAADVPGH